MCRFRGESCQNPAMISPGCSQNFSISEAAEQTGPKAQNPLTCEFVVLLFFSSASGPSGDSHLCPGLRPGWRGMQRERVVLFLKQWHEA